MRKERYIVEIEMPDGDSASLMYIHDVIQSDCDIEDEGRWKVSVKEYWEPSEQEKAALRTAIYIMTKERSFPKLGEYLQNILDVFEGQSREEWKPSDEQIKEGLEEAASDWGIKASVSPISMIIDSGKPIGTQKHTISHQDSFKKGAEWVINKLKALT